MLPNNILDSVITNEKIFWKIIAGCGVTYFINLYYPSIITNFLDIFVSNELKIAAFVVFIAAMFFALFITVSLIESFWILISSPVRIFRMFSLSDQERIKFYLISRNIIKDVSFEDIKSDLSKLIYYGWIEVGEYSNKDQSKLQVSVRKEFKIMGSAGFFPKGYAQMKNLLKK